MLENDPKQNLKQPAALSLNPPIEIPLPPHDPEEEAKLPLWHACG